MSYKFKSAQNEGNTEKTCYRENKSSQKNVIYGKSSQKCLKAKVREKEKVEGEKM